MKYVTSSYRFVSDIVFSNNNLFQYLKNSFNINFNCLKDMKHHVTVYSIYLYIYINTIVYSINIQYTIVQYIFFCRKTKKYSNTFQFLLNEMFILLHNLYVYNYIHTGCPKIVVQLGGDSTWKNKLKKKNILSFETSFLRNMNLKTHQVPVHQLEVLNYKTSISARVCIIKHGQCHDMLYY